MGKKYIQVIVGGQAVKLYLANVKKVFRVLNKPHHPIPKYHDKMILRKASQQTQPD